MVGAVPRFPRVCHDGPFGVVVARAYVSAGLRITRPPIYYYYIVIIYVLLLLL